MFWPPETRFAVSRAVVKKIAVAMKERGDKRDIPQSMWPDVHPRPFFVPQPNKNPVARVEATDAQEFGPGGYNGINEGTKR